MTARRIALTAFGVVVGAGAFAALLLLALLTVFSAHANSYGGDYGVSGLLFLASVAPVALGGAAAGGIAGWRLGGPGQPWSKRPLAAVTLILCTVIAVGLVVALYLDL
jgi:hypothetical protein